MINNRVVCGLIAGGIACSLAACSADEASNERRGSQTAAGSGAGLGGSSGSAGASSGDDGFGNPDMVAPISGASGAINTPPDDVCETIRASADPQIPNMMIVLDRSGSMTEGGRWVPSVSAIRNVTQALQSQISFGLAMFPQPPLDPATAIGDLTACFSAPDPQACLDEIAASACAPGGIVTPIALDNAGPIGQALDMTMPQGGTPTGETLQGLVETYATREARPDETPPAQFILLVTDGQPTCPSGGGSQVTQPDIDISNSAIDQLTMLGVRTYVIGYDTNTPGNEGLAAVLDGFAQRGGTGDTMHHPVEDETSLLAVLQGIAAEVVSCTYALDQAPSRAEFVQVKLDGVQINLGEADGWALIGDRTVEIKGAACEQLRSGGSHSIEVEVQCSIVPPT